MCKLVLFNTTTPPTPLFSYCTVHSERSAAHAYPHQSRPVSVRRYTEEAPIRFPDFVFNDERNLLIHFELAKKISDENALKRLFEETEKKAQKREERQVQESPFNPERDAEKEKQRGWPAPDPLVLSHKLFDREQVEIRMGKLKSLGDRDVRDQIKAQLDFIKKRGEYRLLATPTTDWRLLLDELEYDCPNFWRVIQYARHVFAVADAEGKDPIFAHILLDGPPGVGKTFFAHRLAKIIGTALHVVHLESTQLSNDILGQSHNWSNAQPGMIYDALIDGTHANPVFLLDELDKASGDPRYDVNGGLLGILERGTATRFTDQCMSWLSLDASKIIYIATSNYVESIYPPLLSRLKVFDIDMPADPDAIIQNIFDELKLEMPRSSGDMRLSPGAIQRLRQLSPRKIREALRDGIGCAVYDDRELVRDDDIDLPPAAKSIGF